MKIDIINFAKYLDQNYIFENKPLVAVAVSGGPDSMALVYLVNSWIRKKRGKVIALIVDHNIKKSSKSEAYWTERQLKNYNIKSKILKVNKSKVLKINMNEARNNRYKKIIDHCKKNNILHLFVAHHKDDNLETYINRKISGSDFEGLQAIKGNVLKDKINVVRPLLKFSKKNLYNFNLKNKISFIEDTANKDLKYTRPVIRDFLNSSNIITNNFQKEFDIILKYLPTYRSMIYDLLLKILIKADSKKVELNFERLLKYDDLIIEKLIKIIHKYCFKKDTTIRSKKIQILINSIKKNNFRQFNLKGMSIKRDHNLLVFHKI